MLPVRAFRLGRIADDLCSGLMSPMEPPVYDDANLYVSRSEETLMTVAMPCGCGI